MLSLPPVPIRQQEHLRYWLPWSVLGAVDVAQEHEVGDRLAVAGLAEDHEPRVELVRTPESKTGYAERHLYRLAGLFESRWTGAAA